MGALPYEGIKFAVFDVLKARQPRSIGEYESHFIAQRTL